MNESLLELQKLVNSAVFPDDKQKRALELISIIKYKSREQQKDLNELNSMQIESVIDRLCNEIGYKLDLGYIEFKTNSLEYQMKLEEFIETKL